MEAKIQEEAAASHFLDAFNCDFLLCLHPAFG